MKKSFPIYYSKILVVILCGLLLFQGCANQDNGGVRPVEKAGTIILSVNPAIEVQYDYDGLVMAVTGLNEDGLEISAEEEELIGLPCLVALHTLIQDIYEKGFFSSDFGGTGREIVLLLEKGSVYHKSFLKALEEAVYASAEECGLKAINLTTIEENEIDQKITKDLKLHQLYLPDGEEASEGKAKVPAEDVK